MVWRGWFSQGFCLSFSQTKKFKRMGDKKTKMGEIKWIFFFLKIYSILVFGFVSFLECWKDYRMYVVEDSGCVFRRKMVWSCVVVSVVIGNFRGISLFEENDVGIEGNSWWHGRISFSLKVRWSNFGILLFLVW